MSQYRSTILFGLACCGVLFSANVDPESDKLAAAVRAKDAQFWNAYNACDLTRIHEFFASDVEFYHDKGGPTIGRDALIETFKVNLCGSRGSRLRRVVVPETEAIFPLRKGNELYGAILSGEHLFYVSEPGKKEYLDGRANFTHLWLKQGGELRMTRILSFHHRPAVESVGPQEIVLSQHELEQVAGTYRSPQFGRVTVTRADGHLVLQTERGQLLLYPRTPHLFFVKERDLTFEFQTQSGKSLAMIVRERGTVVDTVPREQ